MLEFALSGVWGAVLLLALVSSVLSLWLHYRTGSLREQETRLHSLELEMHEVFDTVEKWTRRDRVRRLRDGREAATPAIPERGTPEYKAYLRAKMMGGNGAHQ